MFIIYAKYGTKSQYKIGKYKTLKAVENAMVIVRRKIEEQRKIAKHHLYVQDFYGKIEIVKE